MDGRVRIAQRFAIDYALLNDDGRPWRGDELDNASYHGYGAELLAVADGTVVDVKDGLPENVPGLTSRAIPITMATVAGNYVTLKIGEGHYAFYAHLQPGSLRVRLGDRVRRGDVLGLLGNSGNSTAPHLHFHVSDGTSPLGSEGLPYVIDAFDVLGRGVFWNRARATDPVRHEKELPLANMVIQFPDLPEPER
jgi:murein DD-endopeptidase MepM/ murein hydrolase activator NlpD